MDMAKSSRPGLAPLCKWSGGKRDEIKLFRGFYPRGFERYVEPFVGGGAVFFDLEFPGENVINDVHPDLVNFYRQMSLGHAGRIHALASGFGTTERDYYLVRGGGRKLSPGDRPFAPSDDVERAARFIYLRRTCFRGMIRHNEGGEFNVPWGRYKSVRFDDILDERYAALLSRTTITQGDYSQLFQRYDGPENFFFIDQPYDSAFNDYGTEGFGREMQVALADAFRRTRSRCLMVVGGTDLIRGLYDGYVRFEYPKKYSFKIYGGRIGEEINKTHLVITNYTV